LVELAGIAYKQNDFEMQKTHLHGALRLNPGDSYSREFLATIYFIRRQSRSRVEVLESRRQAVATQREGRTSPETQGIAS